MDKSTCNGRSFHGGATSNAVTVATKKGPRYHDLTSKPNLNWLIHMLYARQDYKQCLSIIEHQFVEAYDHEYLYFVKGLIVRLDGNLNGSLQHLQKAFELNPTNPENLKEIAKTLYSMGRWKQAQEAFMKVERMLQRPDHEVCYYLGLLFYRNSDNPTMIEEAKEYFHRAIHNGKQLESYHKLAEIYKNSNNFPKAIEMLESTLAISSENVDTLTEIGILYLRVNDTKSAFDKLFEVTTHHENCSKAYLALGAILQSKNDIDGALNKYKLVEVEHQLGPEIWNNVGLCFFKKRKFIASISCLKKSIWISPSNFVCLYNLGLVFLTAQQYASAFHTLAAASSVRPENAECFMLLGICLRHLNDHANAFLAFERSTMLIDAIKNPLIYLNFSIFCWKTNRIEMAQSNLRNFYQLSDNIGVRLEYKILATALQEQLPFIGDAADSIVETEGKNAAQTDAAAESPNNGDGTSNGEELV